MMTGRLFSPQNVVSILLACVLLALFILEAVRPLRRRRHPLRQRVFVNGCFSALAFLVGTTVTRAAGLETAHWSSERAFGLLPNLPLAPAAKIALGFLLMDLTFYYWHRANHRIPLLWRFHNVHHLDPDLDVTTSFRFHFVEILYSSLFRVVQVGALGITPLTYVSYEAAFTLATMFHHSNVRLPIRVERWANKIFVTPRMHGIHHSIVFEEANSDYSVIFRWWDWLHRTLRLNVPQSAVDIGVAGYGKPEDNRLWALLATPFRRQKDYWKSADGTEPVRTVSGPAVDRAFLSE